MRVEVVRDVAAKPGLVWDVLVDWERQPEWMVDARAVEVTSAHREGEGVRLLCPTAVVGLTITDELEVTRWDPPRQLSVRHLGRVITGTGSFALEEIAPGTRIIWTEEVAPPLGALGEAAARIVVAPWVSWLFGRSLDNLKRLCEAEADRGG